MRNLLLPLLLLLGTTGCCGLSQSDEQLKEAVRRQIVRNPVPPGCRDEHAFQMSARMEYKPTELLQLVPVGTSIADAKAIIEDWGFTCGFSTPASGDQSVMICHALLHHPTTLEAGRALTALAFCWVPLIRLVPENWGDALVSTSIHVEITYVEGRVSGAKVSVSHTGP